jgi:hypothetical protein
MTTYKIELTVEQINVIFQGLHELPGKVCNPIVYEINKQLIDQNKPVETPND